MGLQVKCEAHLVLVWGVVAFPAWEPRWPVQTPALPLADCDPGVSGWGLGGGAFFSSCLSFLVCKVGVRAAPASGVLRKMRFNALK